MHGGVIPEPGQPASHGCIRLPKEFVPVLYESVNVGTPVTITNAPSEIGPPGMESQVPPQNWVRHSRGDGSVQSVTYRNGLPVSSY